MDLVTVLIPAYNEADNIENYKSFAGYCAFTQADNRCRRWFNRCHF